MRVGSQNGRDRDSRPRRRRSEGERRWDALGTVLFAVALAGSGLAFGAQHVPVLLVAAGVALSAALVLGRHLSRLPRLAIVLLALAAYTAFQAAPMPASWVAVLSPAAAEIWSGALRPWHEAGPAWTLLSVDPAGTTVEVLKLTAYACIAVAASGLRAARGSAVVATIVFFASSCVCAVTLAHGVVGASRIYGIFPAPYDYARWTRGPFVNGNNLSGYLLIGLYAGAGLWIAERGPLPKILDMVGVPMLAVGVLLSGSRGGVAALIAGLAAFVWLATAKRDVDRRGLLAGVGVIVGLVVVALFVLGDERLRSGLFEGGLGPKVAPWRWSLGLVHDFPWFGVGRGAFDAAFQPYRGDLGADQSGVYVHAENLLVDAVSEWGLPVGLLALGALAWVYRGLFRRARTDGVAAGLAVGLGALVLQNFVDFGLAIFAVGALAVAVLAMANGGGAQPEEPPRRVSVVHAVATVLAGLAVVTTGSKPAELERKELAAMVSEPVPMTRARITELRQSLRTATLRHPGDAYLPLLGAYLAERGRDQNAMPFLGRALERNPRSGRAHLALADELARHHHAAQALMHYRLAAAYDYGIADRALGRAVTVESDVKRLAAAFAPGTQGAPAFIDLCPKLPPVPRLSCFREALNRDPRDATALAGLAVELLEDVEAERAPCAGPAAAECVAEATRASSALGDRGGREGLMVAARLLARQGRVDEAVRRLLAGCPATPAARSCLELASELAAGGSDASVAKAAMQRFLALACDTTAHCSRAQARVAGQLEESGDLAGALEHYARAAQEEPTTERWLHVAEAAARAGAQRTAADALDHAKSAGALDAAQARRAASIGAEAP